MENEFHRKDVCLEYPTVISKFVGHAKVETIAEDPSIHSTSILELSV